MMGVFGMTGKDAGQMRAFMDTLNRTERLILLLFYADQLSQTEIAMVLDLPEGRVSSMLGTLQRQAADAIKHEGSFGGSVGVSQAMS
jgi:DNA-directed RNA polymerase specialized sigma24 family protein